LRYLNRHPEKLSALSAVRGEAQKAKEALPEAPAISVSVAFDGSALGPLAQTQDKAIDWPFQETWDPKSG
jgi:hypothetical protein